MNPLLWYVLAGFVVGYLVLLERGERDFHTPLGYLREFGEHVLSVLLVIGAVFGFVLLWPFVLMVDWARKVWVEVRPLKGRTPRYITPEKFLENWHAANDRRRFSWRRGRLIVLFQVLPRPSYPLHYYHPKNSVVQAPTVLVWLGLFSFAFIVLPEQLRTAS